MFRQSQRFYVLSRPTVKKSLLKLYSGIWRMIRYLGALGNTLNEGFPLVLLSRQKIARGNKRISAIGKRNAPSLPPKRGFRSKTH